MGLASRRGEDGIGCFCGGRDHGTQPEAAVAQMLINFPRRRIFTQWQDIAALALAACGVRVSVLRPPPSVHGNGDHGFVPRLISIAREKGVSACIGDGLNRWAAVHRLDAAHLYRLVLENSSARAAGIMARPIRACQLERSPGSLASLNVPVVSKSRQEAADHFGWIALFFGMNGPASSAKTQEQLGRRPVQPGLNRPTSTPSIISNTSRTLWLCTTSRT